MMTVKTPKKRSSKSKKRSSQGKSGNDDIENSERNLRVNLIAGGSIVEKTPVFSANGKFLFVVKNNSIVAYETATGTLAYTYKEKDDVSVIVDFTIFDNKLVTCTDTGIVKQWNIDDASAKVKKIKLNPGLVTIITHFKLLRNYEGGYSYLASYVYNTEVRVGIFDPKTGNLLSPLSKLKLRNVEHSLDVGGHADGQLFLAVIQKCRLFVVDLTNLTKVTVHLIAKTREKFTSVRCHSSEPIIATGDYSGQIIIWNDIYKNNAKRAVYHWHTLPVNCLEFSSTGSNFYSGGDEFVLVKWVFDSPLHKSFLPRLNAGIRHISIAEEYDSLAITTADNCIHIFEDNKKLSVVQEISWDMSDGPKFACGLTYDNKSRAIVLNSRVGHVQFFDVAKNEMLFNLDVTNHNQMSQEQHKKNIKNFNVTNFCVSKYGRWFCTVEERHQSNSGVDSGVNYECRMRFWCFDDDSQMWTQNTFIDLPHDDQVINVEFQPSVHVESETNELSCTSIGRDKKFKKWELCDTSSIYKKSRSWKLTATGFFDELTPTCMNYSHDGSLLAIGFGAILTLWDSETYLQKTFLTYTAFKNEPLKWILFGKNYQSHLVLAAGASRVYVWNLLTLSLVWTVQVNLSVICGDVFKDFVAGFTSDNTLYVFSLLTSKYLYKLENAVEKSRGYITAATFVDNSQIFGHMVDFSENYFKIYFITNTQELYTIEPNYRKLTETPETEETSQSKSTETKVTNPFLALKAAQNIKEAANDKLKHMKKRELFSTVDLKQFINLPVVTCNAMTNYCGPIMDFLLNDNEALVHEYFSSMNHVGANGLANKSKINANKLT